MSSFPQDNAMSGWQQVIMHGLKWSAISIICWKGFDVLGQFAGKQSTANLAFQAIMQGAGWPWLAGGGGTGYGLLAHRSKKKAVSEKDARIKKLEERLKASGNIPEQVDKS